ncbi:MAG: putative two-component system sensor kinase, partial [Verrucomicrobiales bacterium]|nr:putative two-component system sensor kinase [Verrucomicrobiales bacterium]
MRMFRVSTVIVLWLAIIRLATISSAAEAKSPAADQGYRVTRWTAENGLPQNSIKAIAQTPDGYLWIGTLYGLARFDGIHFKVYDQSNTPEMIHDSINALVVDNRDGSLWIGTGGGLLRFKNRRFEKPAIQLPSGTSVGIIHGAQNGGIWFSPGTGILAHFQEREGTFQTWEALSEYGSQIIQDILELSSTQILYRTSDRLYILDLETRGVRRFEWPDDPKKPCRACCQDTNGDLWLSASDGLWKVHAGKWMHLLPHSDRQGPFADAIFCLGADAIYLRFPQASGSTLCLWNGETSRPVRIPERPILDISRFLRDREGNLWIGSTEGLFRLEPQRVKVYSDGLDSADVRALTIARNGTVWAKSARGVSAIRAGRITNVISKQIDSNWHPLDVLMADHQNRLWLGFESGQFGIIVNDTFQIFYPLSDDQPYLKDRAIRTIYEDRQERVWIGTSRGVVFQNEGNWTDSLTNTALSCCDVRVIYQDRTGDMWFGSFGAGLYRFHDGAIASFKTDLGEHNNRAWCIHEDTNGVFWVGSQHGLNRFIPPGPGKSEGAFFTFTTQNGLRENIINNIQEDDFGYLWLSGLRGIYQISRAELNQVASGGEKQIHCIAYGEADGMISSECNGGDNQPAGARDHEGRIWFPTTKGVVMIDPKQIRKNEISPPVVIEQVISDDKIVFGDGFSRGPTKLPSISRSDRGLTTTLTVASGAATIFEAGTAHSVEFHYAGNSLTAPERVLFKHRLDGYETDWHLDDQNRRIATYNNLTPGDYSFHVIACNNHGYWNETGAAFKFSIAPKFSQTVWFPVSCALGLLAASGSFAAWRLHWQRRVYIERQDVAVERERARIARNLHDDLSASLSGMALELEAAQRKGSVDRKQLETLASDARAHALNLREAAWTT